MTTKPRIAVLISGRGSNLRALLAGAETFDIAAVLSDRPEAPGLDFARAAGIPVIARGRAEHRNVKLLKQALWEDLDRLHVDAVALAGFMLVVDAPLVARYRDRIINIHPSLLPAHPGLDTHGRALADGDIEHGCTVHLVDEGIDTGTRLASARLTVAPSTSETELARRVLKLEHALYPWVLNRWCSDDIAVDSSSASRIRYTPRALEEANRAGFTLFTT